MLTQELLKILSPSNLKYSVFLQLKEEYKSTFFFLLDYEKEADMKYPVKDYFTDVPISDRSFGDVKEMMDAIQNNNMVYFTEIVLKFPEFDEKKVLDELAYKFIRTIENYVEQVKNLIRYENELLISRVPNKHSGLVDQIDFSEFGSHFLHRDSLADGDILKYDDIDKLPYNKCFLKLLYNRKQSDFEQLAMQSIK